MKVGDLVKDRWSGRPYIIVKRYFIHTRAEQTRAYVVSDGLHKFRYKRRDLILVREK